MFTSGHKRGLTRLYSENIDFDYKKYIVTRILKNKRISCYQRETLKIIDQNNNTSCYKKYINRKFVVL